jgi:hypothetical protein
MRKQTVIFFLTAIFDHTLFNLLKQSTFLVVIIKGSEVYPSDMVEYQD